uniref:Potassium channel tetramerization domain containing 17 n=1 Tax=Sinocyclocheilus grahami TaxID=75366 RepID=A0A672Q831_SINGR
MLNFSKSVPMKKQTHLYLRCPEGEYIFSNNGKWVRLNVGGTVFLTTRQTLLKEQTSFLYRLCQQQDLHSDTVSDLGSILNFPTHSCFSFHTCLLASSSTSHHIPFLHFTSLHFLSLSLIQQVPPKHVYRVLQCQEEELTQMVSTMSDGWKFEQVSVRTCRKPRPGLLWTVDVSQNILFCAAQKKESHMGLEQHEGE